MMQIVETTARYCHWCGTVAYEGSHREDGSFDPESVFVSANDIAKALQLQPMGRSAAAARYAIALGTHVGTRE